MREAIALYTHFPYGSTPEETGRNARVPVADGVRAIKLDPFAEEMRRKGHYLDGSISPAGEERGVAIVAAVREAVGPEVEVLIDAHALYNVPTAIRLANRLEPFNITWFEEPVPPESTTPCARSASTCGRASAWGSACTPASSSCPSWSSAWRTSSCRT